MESHYRHKLYCGIADVPGPILDVGGAGRMEKLDQSQTLKRAQDAERRSLEADERTAQLRRELDLAGKSLAQKDAALSATVAEKDELQAALAREHEVEARLEAELEQERKAHRCAACLSALPNPLSRARALDLSPPHLPPSLPPSLSLFLSRLLSLSRARANASFPSTASAPHSEVHIVGQRGLYRVF